ncbi:hypothetical protein, partial [Streptomyces sp.]|uniref:hypothetical protein n=1 Tax=Streptomyces sp. TaxID=1931 RepID=UPI002D9F7281|nr:hypothetical protein [Streptomyces sp.]
MAACGQRGRFTADARCDRRSAQLPLAATGRAFLLAGSGRALSSAPLAAIRAVYGGRLLRPALRAAAACRDGEGLFLAGSGSALSSAQLPGPGLRTSPQARVAGLPYRAPG